MKKSVFTCGLHVKNQLILLSISLLYLSLSFLITSPSCLRNRTSALRKGLDRRDEVRADGTAGSRGCAGGAYIHTSIPHTETPNHAGVWITTKHLSNSHVSISFPTSVRTNWT
jgi:hypothetical protein